MTKWTETSPSAAAISAQSPTRPICPALRSATADNADGLATMRATLEIRGSEQLVRVLHRLERLPYVQAVRRVAR